MLNIELLQSHKYSTTGSSVIKLIQNTTTENIDLLVRESVQNSLDAHLNNSDVPVDFITGDFSPYDLSSELEKIGPSIEDKFRSPKETFIAIKDSNTIGLVGKLDGEFGKSTKKQNLGKLCFHILKPQDEQGAGGSWGIGKTVYFRIGCGLVFYYSRIVNDFGEYEERLAGTLVEDETKPYGLLAFKEDNLGVAFFGKRKANSDEIEAITDASYIHNFLNIFGIAPFNNSETGTVVIIPFVLNDIVGSLESVNGKPLFWKKTLEDCISMSVLRWYFPRMSKNYKYGPKLIPTVNGSPIVVDDNNPVFKKLFELADSAYIGESVSDWITVVSIERNTNLLEPIIGYFAYGKVSKDELLINKYHLPSPFDYLNLENESSQTNKPIVGFCRKPGMIVNYSVDGPCCGSLSSNEDEFIIGLFILNSNNKIVKPVDINLDEYLRLSEKADHANWFDNTLPNNQNKICIVSKINSSIYKTISSAYGVNNSIYDDKTVTYNLARKFGKLLMPDDTFGKHGSSRVQRRKGGRGVHVVVKKEKHYSISFVEKNFTPRGLVLQYGFSIDSNINNVTCKLLINTLGDPENAETFENDENKPFPFSIGSISYLINSADGKSQAALLKQANFYDDGNKPISFKETRTSKYDKRIGFTINNQKNTSKLEFTLFIELEASNKQYESIFDFDVEEEVSE